MAEDSQKWREAAEVLEEEHTLEMVCREDALEREKTHRKGGANNDETSCRS